MSVLLSEILQISDLCIVAFTFGWKMVKFDYFSQKSCIIAYNSTKSYIFDSKSYIEMDGNSISWVFYEILGREDQDLIDFDSRNDTSKCIIRFVILHGTVNEKDRRIKSLLRCVDDRNEWMSNDSSMKDDREGW